MSDIPSSSTQHLTQTLNQLTTLAPRSTAAQIGVEVIVKHLSGNAIGLVLPDAGSLAGNARGQMIELPKTPMQGQLQTKQHYSLKLSPHPSPALQFFSNSQQPEQRSIALSEQQLQTLLKLPANQLSKALDIASQSTGVKDSSVKPRLISAKVAALHDNKLQLKLSGQAQPLSLTVPDSSQQPFKAGDNIQLALKTSGPLWQVQLTGVAGPSPTINLPKAPLLTLPTEQVTMILKAVLSQAPQVLSLPLDMVIKQLLTQPRPNMDSLLSKLTQLSGNKLGLQSTGNGRFALLAEGQMVTAQLPVSKEILSALSPLKLPLHELISKLLAQNTAQKVAPQDTPQGNIKISTELKADSLKLVHSLLRVVQAKAELPTETLHKIDRAMSDPQLSKEHPLKEFIDTIRQQIKHALPQGKEQDAGQIRQLLSSPALNISTVQLVAPPANQGLIGGLVALIQISLASRLLRNQPGQLERLSQILGPIIAGATKGSPPAQAAKGLADFFQLEQKHQLLKEIGRLLSGHQANKLANAEQAIQGQESFYYTLPGGIGDKVKDIELLIRREQESNKKQSTEATDAKFWNLTMKLSVGEVGELLTKARLRPDHLELDFYASNQATRDQVLNFLPLFNKRLQGLGIEVTKSQCQLGKIPETLQQRPYHVFEAKA
ncbi:MAG: hypothetical protein ACI965_000516 [Paraglaciecola sp.]|jgi:hypothetical protein